MWAYLLRRIAAGIVILFIASFLLFVLVSLSGDPLAQLKANPHVSPATIAAARHALHLDEPIPERYLTWLTGVLHGDLGESTTGQPVGAELLPRLGVTLKYVIPAIVLSVIIGVLVGVLSAVKQYRPVDHVSTALAYLGYSTPTFVVALLLKNFFAVYINQAAGTTVLYTVGENQPGISGSWNMFVDSVEHTILPVITLAVISVAVWSRYQRAATLDVLNADYIRLARAKGLSRRRVLLVHALRNALIPLTTIVALDFATLLGGAIITETVFSWEGMGRYLLEGLTGPVSPDVNVVVGWLMIAATAFIVFNIMADMLYAVLDPKIRYA